MGEENLLIKNSKNTFWIPEYNWTSNTFLSPPYSIWTPLDSSGLYPKYSLRHILVQWGLESTPLHSTPLHSTPLQSSPVQSSPVQSLLEYILVQRELESTPLQSSPY